LVLVEERKPALFEAPANLFKNTITSRVKSENFTIRHRMKLPVPVEMLLILNEEVGVSPTKRKWCIVHHRDAKCISVTTIWNH